MRSFGLWFLAGDDVATARAKRGDAKLRGAVNNLFAVLMRRVPALFASVDKHDIVGRLSRLGVMPLCAQNVEHFLCEYRKVVVPKGRARVGARSEGYAELWKAVQPVLAKRAASCVQLCSVPPVNSVDGVVEIFRA